jgi:NADH-quinone oxidoreductase subunit L
MFRLWLMTFTGEPRDHHVYEHAHESPWQMTMPLVVLAILSVCVAWEWPVPSLSESWLERQIHHAQPASVVADFGNVYEIGEEVGHYGVKARLTTDRNERLSAHELHEVAGNLALATVIIGLAFAFLIYFYRVFDPAESKEQFPAVHDFLTHKWYFDEVYSALFVRPALTIAHWFRIFDLAVIDGAIHGLARATVKVSDANGSFDRGFIDGIANLIARVCGGVGRWLRHVQTGYLRSYVLFLVLAVAGLFVLLSYFVSLAVAR